MATANPTSAPAKPSRIPLGARSGGFSPTYGRIVNFLKILLPTLAVVLISLVVAWPLLDEQVKLLNQALVDAVKPTPDSMQITNARYAGRDEKNQPFTVTAETIRQPNIDEPFIGLTLPKADIMMADETWAALTAADGTYDRDLQILTLQGDVSFFHDLGYEFKTQSARVDLQAGGAAGDEPIFGQGPFGLVEAQGFRIYERGARVRLLGKSKLVIYQDVEDQQ
ncbi:MAG: LPS export ABC transporter periplasmic protein LptC [Alphaproteobacteria bacterium]